MKKVLIWVLLVVLTLMIYIFYKLSTFTLFDVEFTVLQTIEIPQKDYKLRIYSIPPNATSQSYVQIRKVENEAEEVIANFERYNDVKNYNINGDSISFILVDTSSVKVKLDTMSIKLP